MGAMAPMAKSCGGGGDAPTGILLAQVFETVKWVNFCTGVLSPLYTVKDGQ